MLFLLTFVVLVILKLSIAVTWSWWIICLPLIVLAFLWASLLAFGAWAMTHLNVSSFSSR